MNAQHIFYIFGSIAFAVITVWFLIVITVILLIKAQITKISERIATMSDEVQDLVATGKRYTETLGNGFIASLALKVIKSFLRKRK